jgi:putative ABC transport system permease protein
MLASDLTHAWRRLAATPAFTVFSIATLALGIGATTAVYSAIYTTVLRPPALEDAERVANLYHRDPRRGGSLPMLALSAPDLADYAAGQTSFSALAGWSRFRHALVAGGTSEVVWGEMVGGEYFAVVGIEAALGRTLQPADDRLDAPRVMVLGYEYWRRRFGADPGVLGQTVNLGGDLFEIVGVMPARFRGVDAPNVVATAGWVPLSSTRAPDGQGLHDRERRWLFVKGRLKPGVTMEQALAEFQAVGRQLDLEAPLGGSGSGALLSGRRETRDHWFLMPAANVRMHESTDALAGPLVITMMVAVGLVLLVACTNIANLMLARGSARRHEHAVRLALGASRWRLIRAQLVEAALVTVAGGLGAYIVARLVMRQLLTASYEVTSGFVIRFEPEFHSSVALVGVFSTLLALFVFGLIPAMQATRASLRESLASGGPGSVSPRWRGRRNLLALQVTVSAGLVAVALLCAQQLLANARQDSGMDLDRIAFAQVDFGLLRRDEAHGRGVLEEALRRARLLPGIKAVAVSSGLPAGVRTRGVAVERISARNELVAATPAIFQVLGIPIVEGRPFGDRDGVQAPPVAVISQRLAKMVSAEGTAVGRSVTIRRTLWAGEPPSVPRTVTIIGVAADTDTGTVGRRDGGVVYLPFAQHYEGEMVLVARAAASPAALPGRLRQIFQEVDAETAVLQAETGVALTPSGTDVLRVGAIGSGLLGVLALVLAMAGLYGVMADLVSRRTREIGIRAALGAGRDRILRMVLLDAVRPVVEGLLLGLGLGVVLRMTFRPMFVRALPAFDPLIALVVPAAFLACALIAAYVPARRAARVDPVVALRAE